LPKKKKRKIFKFIKIKCNAERSEVEAVYYKKYFLFILFLILLFLFLYGLLM